MTSPEVLANLYKNKDLQHPGNTRRSVLRIRDLVLFGAFLIHGSWMGKKSGSGIQVEHPGSYFPELRNNFLDYKYVYSLMRILNFFDPGSGFSIRDGKIQIGISIPYPQHCNTNNRQKYGLWHFSLFIGFSLNIFFLS